MDTDPRAYMLALHSGDILEAYKIARGPNPFASICGMICGAPCESSCRKDRVDKTLTIRAQKRFIDEWYGNSREKQVEALAFSYARGSVDAESNGLRVACVGGGVASLTAAHDLLRVGYEVHVFEQMPMLGGMLTYGVPTYRLKNDLALNECYAVEALGAKIHCNTKVGRDVTMDELDREFDAIFVGNGLWKSRDLPIEGAEETDVIRGVEYLRVLCAEERWPIDGHLVVIGGGNVAFDVARSSVRNGASRVTMICMESRDEEPADEFEIEDGVEEGIELVNRVGPKGIVRDQAGKISGVRCQEIHHLFDADGKFNPVWVPDTEFVIECDRVALAIGQSMDLSLFEGWSRRDELEIERGVIKTERDTGRTTAKGVYCGGDGAFGAALFINAVKHGQDAARAIDEDLRNVKPYREYSAEFTTIQPTRDKEYLRAPWALPDQVAAEERVGNVDYVENNYTYEQAQEQASRCLQCHISPVFDGHLCIKCNGCIDVCPTNCLALVSVPQVDLENGEMRKAVDNFYGVDSSQMEEEELADMGSMILKDEDLCIRCGLCAEKCPTQAVTMDVMNYSYRWIG